MKGIKSLFCSILLLVCFSYCFLADNLLVSRAESKNQEQKTYCTATIDEEFDGTSESLAFERGRSEQRHRAFDRSRRI